ncbi:MAG: type II toxin-antitoxin system HipA family toxin [Burkholderiales bacterium]|jgi:serine/threonine-protein kinase HipA|nr:type II toxin-antitoxin system HipA family toxin [Burkholderiales bacterium]
MGGLAIWMNGELVGTWSAGDGRGHVFDYAESWPQSERSRPLSLSMPLTASLRVRGPAVENYFDNLLPDSDAIRKRIRNKFGTRSTEAFDLLAAIGRDCVGAAQLMPVGEEPPDIRRVDYEPLSEEEVEKILRGVSASPAFGGAATDDFRISIAGAQEKTALLNLDGAWCRPQGATPTTHIMKLPLGHLPQFNADFTTSVENEWLCGKILSEFGLTVAESSVLDFGKQRVLAVERFDREWIAPTNKKKRYLLRLPQEDMCQALGVSPNKKYESEGGPGMKACLDILGNSEAPWLARIEFVLAQLGFWLLAAPDGHAKNFSIFLHRGAKYSPTPLYDVLSAWPFIGKSAGKVAYQNLKLAMAIRSKNPHYEFGEIETRHWKGLAEQAGEGAWEGMQEMVGNVRPALKRVEAELPDGFPAQVWDTISAGVRKHAAKFMRGV